MPKVYVVKFDLLDTKKMSLVIITYAILIIIKKKKIKKRNINGRV
jgi:hypothetical protein